MARETQKPVINCSIANCGGAADSDCTDRFCNPISSPAENQPREGLYEVIKEEAKKAIRAKRVCFFRPLCPYCLFCFYSLQPLQVELFMFISAHQTFAPNLKVNSTLTPTG
jgi:hypothetical protein